jgi:preprotein translocase subunit YajC
MFVSPAYAQTGGGAGGFDLVALLPLVLIFVVFYFLIIRPQQKKMKDHKALVEGLRRGDRVVTSGGIIGTVAKVTGDREIAIEIADGVRVRAMRGMIAEVLARTEPTGGEKAEKAPRSGDKNGAESEDSYYKRLGVAKSATAAEIDAAFAAKPNEAEAYEALKDPTKRKLYDRLGHDEYVAALND